MTDDKHMKFVFFGYDFSFPVLKRLIDDGNEPIAIFTFECDNVFNFNREIIKLAQERDLPFTMAKPTADEIQYYTNAGAQLFLSCGYPYKIPNIDNEKAYGLNMHPSLLPRGRGLMPSPHIIMHEPEIAGFTIHKLTSEYDAGDILHQEKIELSDTDTVDSYSAEIARRSPNAISKVVSEIEKHWNNAAPQDQTQASTFPPPDESMRTFDWNASIKQIDRVGRAFGSFGSLAIVGDKKIAIFAYEVKTQDHDHTPGVLIEQTKDHITIAAADGIVIITKFMVI